MRPRYAWLLIAAAGIGLVVGVRLSAGGGNDRGSGPTTSTTAGSAAIAEFARLHGDRVRALETWTPAVAAPLTAFLPVSGKVMREEQRIMERAAATANTCDTADEDPCRLLGILHELADRERSRLGMLVRAKRLDRRAEAYAAFTGLRSDNCDYAGKVVDLLDRPSSPDLLSRRLPMLRDHAYAIALTACDATRNSDQMLLGAARAARVRPTAWPPSVLRMHLPADEWRIYATAVDRSAVMVEKVLAELQSDLEAVRDGFMPPEAFADVAGPDPAAAQSWLYLDDHEPIKDSTLIGRLAEAQRLVAELGPPAAPDVRRAWQAYQKALENYEVAVQRAASGDLDGMRSALTQGNSFAAPALAAFASHRQ